MVDFQESNQWEELLASYVLGDLTPEEVAVVHQLLESHPELKTEVSRLQTTLALFPLALPETSPPATLGSQILKVASHSAIDAPHSRSNRVVSKGQLWVAACATITAALMIGLGLQNYRLNQQLARSQSELSQYQKTVAFLRQPSNRLLSLRGSQAIPQASGSLVVVPSAEVALLTLQNLTPLPEGQVYRLWAVADGKKIYCGEFQPDSQGKVLVEMPLDNVMSESSSVVVTIEPLQKNLQPMGKTVMTGSMSL